MARKDASGSKPAKKPGRIKQMVQVFQMTRRQDARLVPYMLASFVLPLAAGVVVGILLGGGSVFSIVLWTIAGALAGLLIAMIVLGRRAEKAAYAQIEGRPGAVGAVLRSALKRGWRGSEDPVAVNPKTQDAIYRAVGRGGVVLICEGPARRTNRMLNEERRTINRTVPNVAVTVLTVGPDEDSVPLRRIPRRLARIKPALTKAEVNAVYNRLTSMKGDLPIPKGMDPFKTRPQRAR